MDKANVFLMPVLRQPAVGILVDAGPWLVGDANEACVHRGLCVCTYPTDSVLSFPG
jgi:hypothetical protein